MDNNLPKKASNGRAALVFFAFTVRVLVAAVAFHWWIEHGCNGGLALSLFGLVGVYLIDRACSRVLGFVARRAMDHGVHT